MCANRRNGGWGGRGLIGDKSESSQPGRQGNRRLEDGGSHPPDVGYEHTTGAQYPSETQTV
jgi:hypothetical protein